MAHQIDQTVNARGAFLSRIEKAWHGLGEVLPDLPMQIILRHPGIDFRVGLDQVRTVTGGKIVPNQFATVRDDSMAPLAIVGTRYTVVQHTDEMALFDEVLAPAGYLYETAGVLNGGAQVFLLAKRPESIMVAEGDEVRQFLLVKFSYDGKSKTIVKTVTERVVCDNTLAIALGETGSSFDFAIRHTASAQDKLNDLRASLSVAQDAFRRFESDAAQLVRQPWTRNVLESVMRGLVDEVLGDRPTTVTEIEAFKKGLDRLTDGISTAMSHPNQNVDGISGTKWSLYNAVSQWADHTFARGVKGTDREKAERRFMSVVGGRAHEIKTQVWKQLLAA